MIEKEIDEEIIKEIDHEKDDHVTQISPLLRHAQTNRMEVRSTGDHPIIDEHVVIDEHLVSGGIEKEVEQVVPFDNPSVWVQKPACPQVPSYIVKLTATARVSCEVTVDAKSTEEAKIMAEALIRDLDPYSDDYWEYDGLLCIDGDCHGTLEVTEVTCDETGECWAWWEFD